MTSCPSCGIELGETTDEEGYPVYIDCPNCGEPLREYRPKECCMEVLSWIEYRDYPEWVNGRHLKVEMKSGDLHYCALCGKILGSCPFCDADYACPIMLFIDEGKRGMIALCLKCFNKLGLKPVLKP